MLKKLLLVSLIVAPIHADDQSFLDAVSRPVLYSVPGLNNIRVRRDVIYRTEPELAADIYAPLAKGPAPAVILIHGGVGADLSLRPKDWGSYQSWGRLLAASGFVAITFNHRLGFPDPKIHDAASDVAALIEFVRKKAAKLGVDQDRIALMAFSAGGPLLSPALREHPPFVKCIVSMYNFLDIRNTNEHPRFESYTTLREFSPSLQVSEQSPPMMVVRAGRDQIPKLNESIAVFMKRAIDVNAPVTFMIHPAAPHGFENKTDDARTKEIIRGVLDFLTWHLGR